MRKELKGHYVEVEEDVEIIGFFIKMGFSHYSFHFRAIKANNGQKDELILGTLREGSDV